MLGLYLGAFLGMLSETSMNIALPALCDEFGITTGTAQWMVVGYMLAIGIVLPCVGLLLKWVKAKTLVIVALCCFLVGAVVSAASPVFALVLAGRILQGVGPGIVLPSVYAALMRVFPPAQIGAANGVAGLVVMFAPVIGPTLAGLLIGMFSWRAIFALFAVVAVAAIACTAAFFVTPIETTRPRIDVTSVVASVIGFGCLVAGVSLVSDMGASGVVIGLLVVGVLVLAFYVWRQLHLESPLLDLKILGLRSFTVPALMVTCSFACTLAIMYIAPQELQRGLGFDATTAGLLMLAGGVVNAICSFGAGRLFDRFGAVPLVRLGACGVHDRHPVHAAVRPVRRAQGPAPSSRGRRLHDPQHHAAGCGRGRHRHRHLPADGGTGCRHGGGVRGSGFRDRISPRLHLWPGADRHRPAALVPA